MGVVGGDGKTHWFPRPFSLLSLSPLSPVAGNKSVIVPVFILLTFALHAPPGH